MTDKTNDPLDLAPHSTDAEEAALGSILMWPDVLDELRAIPLVGDDFFHLRHGWIYDAICRIADRSEDIDTRTIAEELREQDRLDDVGGEGYINYLSNTVPTALHAETYGRIVKRSALRRQLLGAAGEVAKLAHDTDQDVSEVINKAQDIIFRVARPDTGGIVTFDQALSEVWELYEDGRNGNNRVIVMDSPWRDFNKVVKGLRKGQLVIPASRPGMGKSAMSLQWATHAAKLGKHVLICSLEMTSRELIGRIIAQELDISTDAQDEMDKEQWDTFVGWVGGNAINLRNIMFDDSGEQTPMKLTSRARDMKRRGNLDVLIVDYIQLMKGDYNRGDSRATEVGDISRQLKTLAMSLDIPVIAPSQLNRENVKANKPPGLHNLRESGSLEQDADMVIFIHDPEAKEDDEDSNQNGKRHFIVAKQRGGPTSNGVGVVPVVWLGERVRFDNLHNPFGK